MVVKEIPKQLQNKSFRFVLLGKWNHWKNSKTNEVKEFPPEDYKQLVREKVWKPLGKAPYEKAWEKKGYEYTDQKLRDHVEGGKNFGIIGGHGELVVLDIDDGRMGELLQSKLNTFTVFTGGGGRHFYFICDYKINHVLMGELGELRARNYQVVCPPCIHPSGRKYKTIIKKPIRKISEDELLKIIRPYLRKEEDVGVGDDGGDKPKDTSRSGFEFGKIISLLKNGLSDDEVKKQMLRYSKWKEAPQQYRNLTFNKAKLSFESERKYKKHSLEDYKKVLHKWFYYTDEELIEIQLATLIGEKIGGDPLWTFIIAPPGALKTEFLRSFALSDNFYPISDLTSKTFVSGLMLGKGEDRRKIEDLLPQLDKKVLIFKDFTTVLEKGREERQEIFAQLREIYDGSFAKKFGTMDKAVRYESRFGFIAGVTPIVDKHWKLMQQLGERFLKARWEEDSKLTTIRARENEGKEKIMRDEVTEASMGFVNYLDFSKIPEFDDEELGEDLDRIAEFIAIARTPVTIQDYRTDFYFDFIPTPERPTRLVKQLKKMCKGLALIRNKSRCDGDEIKTITRIAMDTIPQDRLHILKAIVRNEGMNVNGCPRPAIYKEVKIPESSIIRVIEQLKMLELVNTIIMQEQSSMGYVKQEYYHKTTEKANLLLPPSTLTEDTVNVGGCSKCNSTNTHQYNDCLFCEDCKHREKTNGRNN